MTVRVSPDLTSACPRGCSGHGECLQGQCQCSPGYIGQDCALSEYLPVKQLFLLYLLFKPFSYCPSDVMAVANIKLAPCFTVPLSLLWPFSYLAL